MSETDIITSETAVRLVRELADVKAELAAYRDIVEALAKMDPEATGDPSGVCRFCDEWLDSHEPDCPWLKAKTLVDKEAEHDN